LTNNNHNKTVSVPALEPINASDWCHPYTGGPKEIHGDDHRPSRDLDAFRNRAELVSGAVQPLPTEVDLPNVEVEIRSRAFHGDG